MVFGLPRGSGRPTHARPVVSFELINEKKDNNLRTANYSFGKVFNGEYSNIFFFKFIKHYNTFAIKRSKNPMTGSLNKIIWNASSSPR